MSGYKIRARAKPRAATPYQRNKSLVGRVREWLSPAAWFGSPSTSRNNPPSAPRDDPPSGTHSQSSSRSSEYSSPSLPQPPPLTTTAVAPLPHNPRNSSVDQFLSSRSNPPSLPPPQISSRGALDNSGRSSQITNQGGSNSQRLSRNFTLPLIEETDEIDEEGAEGESPAMLVAGPSQRLFAKSDSDNPNNRGSDSTPEDEGTNMNTSQSDDTRENQPANNISGDSSGNESWIAEDDGNDDGEISAIESSRNPRSFVPAKGSGVSSALKRNPLEVWNSSIHSGEHKIQHMVNPGFARARQQRGTPAGIFSNRMMSLPSNFSRRLDPLTTSTPQVSPGKVNEEREELECAQPTFAVPDKPLSRFGVPKNVHVATPFPGTSNRDRSRNSMFTNATPSFITPYKNSARFTDISLSHSPFQSPFYSGKTAFGGSATGQRVTSAKRPRTESSPPMFTPARHTTVRARPVAVRRPAASQTARKIMETLETLSSPLADARRLPMMTGAHPAKRRRSDSHPSSVLSPPPITPLRHPSHPHHTPHHHTLTGPIIVPSEKPALNQRTRDTDEMDFSATPNPYANHSWSCDTCRVSNKSGDLKCSACGAGKRNSGTESARSKGVKFNVPSTASPFVIGRSSSSAGPSPLAGLVFSRPPASAQVIPGGGGGGAGQGGSPLDKERSPTSSRSPSFVTPYFHHSSSSSSRHSSGGKVRSSGGGGQRSGRKPAAASSPTEGEGFVNPLAPPPSVGLSLGSGGTLPSFNFSGAALKIPKSSISLATSSAPSYSFAVPKTVTSSQPSVDDPAEQLAGSFGFSSPRPRIQTTPPSMTSSNPPVSLVARQQQQQQRKSDQSESSPRPLLSNKSVEELLKGKGQHTDKQREKTAAEIDLTDDKTQTNQSVGFSVSASGASQSPLIKTDLPPLKPLPQFAPPPGSWSCDTCCVSNKSSDAKCVACGSGKPADKKPILSKPSVTTAKTPPTFKPLAQFAAPPGSWSCDTCCVSNKSSDSKCVACGGAKPADKNSAPSDTSVPTSQPVFKPLSQFAPSAGSWTCDVCMISNKPEVSACVACTAPKPGSNSGTKPEESKNGNIKFASFGTGTEGGMKLSSLGVVGSGMKLGGGINLSNFGNTGMKLGSGDASTSEATPFEGGMKIGGLLPGSLTKLAPTSNIKSTSEESSTGGFKLSSGFKLGGGLGDKSEKNIGATTSISFGGGGGGGGLKIGAGLSGLTSSVASEGGVKLPSFGSVGGGLKLGGGLVLAKEGASEQATDASKSFSGGGGGGGLQLGSGGLQLGGSGGLKIGSSFISKDSSTLKPPEAGGTKTDTQQQSSPFQFTIGNPTTTSNSNNPLANLKFPLAPATQKSVDTRSTETQASAVKFGVTSSSTSSTLPSYNFSSSNPTPSPSLPSLTFMPPSQNPMNTTTAAPGNAPTNSFNTTTAAMGSAPANIFSTATTTTVGGVAANTFSTASVAAASVPTFQFGAAAAAASSKSAPSFSFGQPATTSSSSSSSLSQPTFNFSASQPSSAAAATTGGATGGATGVGSQEKSMPALGPIKPQASVFGPSVAQRTQEGRGLGGGVFGGASPLNVGGQQPLQSGSKNPMFPSQTTQSNSQNPMFPTQPTQSGSKNLMFPSQAPQSSVNLSQNLFANLPPPAAAGGGGGGGGGGLNLPGAASSGLQTASPGLSFNFHSTASSQAKEQAPPTGVGAGGQGAGGVKLQFGGAASATPFQFGAPGSSAGGSGLAQPTATGGMFQFGQNPQPAMTNQVQPSLTNQMPVATNTMFQEGSMEEGNSPPTQQQQQQQQQPFSFNPGQKSFNFASSVPPPSATGQAGVPMFSAGTATNTTTPNSQRVIRRARRRVK